MCTSPIWIANRRYTRKDHDISLPMSNLAQNPWDVARFRLLVPCGQCEECLKALRNDWYVRLRQELTRCRAEREEAWFVTITINPTYYDEAFDDPTSFMRKWFERVRHVTGRSIKHAFFQEFGIHPQSGSAPRLHFHGFLFAPRMTYNAFRKVVSQFGYVWLCQATAKRARYCVKYVVKNLNTNDYEISDELRLQLSARKYTRKFISPGVGRYLGAMPHPDVARGTWSFDTNAQGGCYRYRIPRYYDQFLSERSKFLRSFLSASAYASYFADSVVINFLRSLAKRFMVDQASLAFDKKYASRLASYLKYAKGSRIAGSPFICTRFAEVIDVWKNAFDIDTDPSVIFNKSLTYG